MGLLRDHAVSADIRWYMVAPNQEKQKRILVIRAGALGDFILTLPVLQALREKWPASYIEVIGHLRSAVLAGLGGLSNRVKSIDRAGMAAYFGPGGCLPKEEVEYLRSFDLVISYLHDPEGEVKQKMLKAGIDHLVCASPIVQNQHAVQFLLKPLSDIGIHSNGREVPALNLDERNRQAGFQKVKRLGKRMFAVHPGSGSPKKNWPLTNFISLAGKLTEKTKLTPFFLLGEAETEEALSEKLQGECPDIPVLSNMDTVALCQVLNACRGYLGNDSGVTHLAAALGIPAVALFGPTDPRIWGPVGPNVRNLQPPAGNTDITGIEVETVFRKVKELCGCL